MDVREAARRREEAVRSLLAEIADTDDPGIREYALGKLHKALRDGVDAKMEIYRFLLSDDEWRARLSTQLHATETTDASSEEGLSAEIIDLADRMKARDLDK